MCVFGYFFSLEASFAVADVDFLLPPEQICPAVFVPL
jgi:hypothetical protein